MADKIGIAISGLCSFLFWPYPLSSNDPAKRNRGIELASCNLVGPILLDPVTGKGKQVVLKNATNYSSRQPIFKPGA